MLRNFYQKIQVIMTLLGYYDGQCDGVWGPKCIEAKRKWELDDDFEPGVPANGLPFNGRGKLPKGMHYAYKGLDIIWDKWDEVRAQEILREKGQLLTAALVDEHVTGSKQAAVQKVPEHVATVNTVQQEPLKSAVLNVTDVQPEPAQAEPSTAPAEEEEELTEENTSPEVKTEQPRNPNWTKNRNK